MHLREQVTQPADPSYRIIPLTQGKVALVDTEDYEAISKFNWCATQYSKNCTFYALRRDYSKENPAKSILMHRQILNAPAGFDVDHRDGNGLDNRKHNLRVSTRSQNLWNSKSHIDNACGLKGVIRKRNKWQARIFTNGKVTHLGVFLTPELAHAAYIEAAKRLHGEFARW